MRTNPKGLEGSPYICCRGRSIINIYNVVVGINLVGYMVNADPVDLTNMALPEYTRIQLIQDVLPSIVYVRG